MGDFLCRKFPQVCGLNSCSVGQNAWKTVEMLSFISALQKEYPNKVIKVSYIQAVSRSDTAEFCPNLKPHQGIISLHLQVKICLQKRKIKQLIY